MCGFPCEKLMHDEHENQDQQQIKREQPYGNMVGYEPEDRRHDAGADVGAGHLNADDGLGFICAKMRRCGVDDAWVYGSTWERAGKA